MSATNLPKMQKAARWHPPSFNIKVEEVPVPRIQHPDDAIVRVQLAGLCGSDLHIYRGTAGSNLPIHTCGHEIVGEVVELGSNFGRSEGNRSPLYQSLKVGDRVVSAFSTSCGECNPCRLGYTCRCVRSLLLGSPQLDGGQAQFIRIPDAGGTLFSLSDPGSWPSENREINDASLLLLSDILPTAIFAATQILNHPKVLTVLTEKAFPTFSGDLAPTTPLVEEDTTLTIAIIGLGPVGMCSAIALLDLLHSQDKIPAYRIVAIDLSEHRREKMKKICDRVGHSGEFVCASADQAPELVEKWTNGIGCTAVLEAVGNPDSLKSAYGLVRAFGLITSVGVHSGSRPFPLLGSDLYNKNVSLDFGRCPARAMIPRAFKLLASRQDIFGEIGGETGMVEKVLPLADAADGYRAFNDMKVGKILFDPWM